MPGHHTGTSTLGKKQAPASNTPLGSPTNGRTELLFPKRFIIDKGLAESFATHPINPVTTFFHCVRHFTNMTDWNKQTHCKHSLFCTTCIWSIFFGSIYRLFRSWASRSDAPGRPGFGYGCFYFVCAMKLYNEFLLLNGTVFGATFVSLPNKDLHPNCTV